MMTEEPFFEIKTLEKKKDFARLEISPLARGFGNTLGTALRRVLLSSLPGAVITRVKISGVRHQFSTLKGMREDIVDFLLNLKTVRFSYENNKPSKASLSVQGPKEVTAKDLELEPGITLINPDTLLAVLSKGAKLDVKLEIESGVGYSPAEDRNTGEVGLIPLDAAFSPIRRVNFTVEETRVGRLTDFDKLIIEISTDGSVDPEDALKKSSIILISYFNQIINPKKIKKEEEIKEQGLGPIGKLSVEEINLPTRVANALVKTGYETVEDLVNAKRADLVKVRNLGEKSVKIIEAALGEKDLKILE